MQDEHACSKCHATALVLETYLRELDRHRNCALSQPRRHRELVAAEENLRIAHGFDDTCLAENLGLET